MNREQILEETNEFLNILLQDYIPPKGTWLSSLQLAYKGTRWVVYPRWEYPGYLAFRADAYEFKCGTDDTHKPEIVLQYEIAPDQGRTYSTDDLLPAFTVPEQSMAELMQDRYKHRDALIAYFSEAVGKVIELNQLNR